LEVPANSEIIIEAEIAPGEMENEGPFGEFAGFMGQGHGKRVGRTIADITPIKRITVVDADVDIRDPSHVDWALNSRFSPQRDTVIIDDVYVPLQIDPSVRDVQGHVWQGSKIILDATQKIDSGPFSLPSKQMMTKGSSINKSVNMSFGDFSAW
jgi:3-polyprenyl-4-hydroxybenzoate decarboxylase